MRKTLTLTILAILIAAAPVLAQKKKTTPAAKATAAKDEKKDPFNSGTFSGLSFRSIGPSVTSGRISDLAVNPENTSEYYVASASGGVWKTTNHGVTFAPIFDGQGSYSIGVVELDPSNPATVWVGTGENNNQRSVAYGDGVYRSDDAGKSWKHMGLKNSEHISGIIIDPTNSNTIWVGAYGPVWKEGGERGVYKSTDGGATWTCVKAVSDYTGCNDIVMDPRNPNVVYAAFHQRMRKVFTYIGGGPESAIYKTTDGGTTWKKLEGGLPGGDVGRIALGISPVNPDVLYAVAEAPEGKGGVFRSNDRGASWQKQSGYYSSGNYYQEVTCDPKNVDRIFVADTYYQVSDNGGKNMRNLGEINKHIDNHCIWIDPANTDHLLVGCDGGVYETWDFAGSWDFKSNLPVTQFYKVSTDNASPFYHVHGGTQDNLSLGGPSRSISGNGIVNSDWYVTSTGDGFETQVDQSNPDIIYAQAQYGYLSRFDRKTGENLDIRPVEGEGEPAYRWNWDAPLLISQHSNTRLYFGANKLFRTDDRGNSWKVISPDLSRQIDRNKLEVMGKVWSVDAIAKNGSTDIYGQLTSIAESKFNPDLLWVGTDDGLIHLTRDGGQNWTKIDNLSGAPAQSYVHQIIASLHDQNVAYVCFNHHRYGDFKPYLFKTSDGGKTWKSVSSNLPERGSIYSIAEDHVDANLLFVGTEFGAFFSNDGGGNWVQLKAGLPTIAVRDIEIQRRENDLVLATFGRGFYVLDDYTPLRNLQKSDLDKQAIIFPVKDALMFMESYPLGLRDKGHLGSSYFSAPNPKVGAVFSYYIKEDIKTLKDKRREAEKAQAAKGEKVYYPNLDSLRLEDNQPAPYLLFTVTDADGNVVRHLKTSAKKGLQRVVWDFRYGTQAPTNQRFTPAPDQLFGGEELGYRAMPGRYSVSLQKFEDGVLSPLAGPVSFECKALNASALPAADKKDYDEFCKKVANFRRALSAANDIRGNMQGRIGSIKTAIQDMPAPAAELTKRAYALEQRLNETGLILNGDATLARREFETPPAINGRIGQIQGGMWSVTSAPTETMRASYRVAEKQFGPVLNELKAIAGELQKLEEDLEMKGAPYTPGRWPKW